MLPNKSSVICYECVHEHQQSPDCWYSDSTEFGSLMQIISHQVMVQFSHHFILFDLILKTLFMVFLDILNPSINLNGLFYSKSAPYVIISSLWSNTFLQQQNPEHNCKYWYWNFLTVIINIVDRLKDYTAILLIFHFNMTSQHLI